MAEEPAARDEAPENEGGPLMSFLDHLEDLRWTLVKCAIAMVAALLLCLALDDKLAGVMELPIRRMNILEGDHPTITLLVGRTRLGPYEVTRDAVPGLPAEGVPHLVFRLEVSGTGEAATASFKLDPKADPGATPVRLRNFNPAEGFMVAFNLALYASVALSAPFWMFFLGQYIMPALKARERRILFTWIGWGSVLFLAGVLLTYFYLLPLALRASVQYSNMLGFDPYDWRADEYIGFAGKFMLGMGLGFQLPLVVLTLVKIGLLSYRTLAHFRRHVIVVAFVLGAVLTTPEVITQVAMALPLCVLYEACIWIAWYWERKERRLAAERDAGGRPA